MDTKGPSEEEREPQRPRVIDKRISSRQRAPGAVEAPAPPEPSRPDPQPPVVAAPEPPRDAGTVAAPPPPSRPSAVGSDEPIWTPEQEEEARRMAEEIAATSSRDWVLNAAVTMANVAGTKLQLGDAADAQLAIDALTGLLGAVGPQLGDAEQPLRQLLAQLQLLYAERVSGGPEVPQV